MNNIYYEIKNGIAIIRMNHRPVNELNQALRQEIVSNIKRAEEDAIVTATILIGSEKGFSGGSDIREFGTDAAFAEPTLPSVINMIETSSKPVIAAVDGVCMGGGLELALGCHFRVTVPNSMIALPEVKLGLIPGAGGTQRLPRLIGIEPALNMILSGNTISSNLLRHTSLFDHFVEGDLLQGAIAFAEKVVFENSPLQKVRNLKVTHPKPAAFFMYVRNSVRAVSKNSPAQLKCVEAVEAALTKTFEEGMAIERDLFANLYLGEESRALRHLFISERKAAKVDDLEADVKPRTINSVGIVGAGTMGSGIAINFLLAGIPTVILETNQEALSRGIKYIGDFFQSRVNKGKINAAESSAFIALLKPTLNYSDLANVDLAIEAVFETMAVKKTVFEELDKVCRKGAILASNTSTLDLDKIAAFTKRPEDVVGTHFFSPANVMKLLEVVRGARTAGDVLLTIMHVAKRINKTAVVSGVCDGFIGNRMIAGYSTEATKMLEEGASVQQIDVALERFGMAMGPFRMGDLAGNDIGWLIRKGIREQHPDFQWPTATRLADKLCELGRFGQKTGSGWYRYESGGRVALSDPKVDALVDAHRKENGIKTRKLSNAEIVQRCIFSLVIEGARILEEGIAQRASDIDIVYAFGYGFPRSRGGPMLYADSLGLLNVQRSIEGFAANDKSALSVWRPAPLLIALAAEGKTFN